MQDRARNHPKINIVLESEVVDILGDESVRGATLRNIATGQETTAGGAGDLCRHRPQTQYGSLQGYHQYG